MLNKDLKDRIIEISKKHKLSHLGSCLTCVDIIDEIYSRKKSDEKFVLSCGHAGLALYVVLEKLGLDNAENILDDCGIHPDRCNSAIDCSTGSLGQGLPIAVGMALADRKKTVYCLISDGESMEGSIYESANVIRKFKITNLEVYCNFNGFSAYDAIPEKHIKILKTIFPKITIVRTNVEDYGLSGLSAHYITVKEIGD